MRTVRHADLPADLPTFAPGRNAGSTGVTTVENSADGQVDLDTAPFAVMWFLLGRDISEDELSLYTENMKPLWKRAGLETPTLDAAQREALQEREAELLFSDG